MASPWSPATVEAPDREVLGRDGLGVLARKDYTDFMRPCEQVWGVSIE